MVIEAVAAAVTTSGSVMPSDRIARARFFDAALVTTKRSLARRLLPGGVDYASILADDDCEVVGIGLCGG